MEILEFVKLDDMDPLLLRLLLLRCAGGCRREGVQAADERHERVRLRGHRTSPCISGTHRDSPAGQQGMTLHTMFYSNEIRAAESVPTDKVELKDQEKSLRTS